jgi:hypothetical protein
MIGSWAQLSILHLCDRHIIALGSIRISCYKFEPAVIIEILRISRDEYGSHVELSALYYIFTIAITPTQLSLLLA